MGDMGDFWRDVKDARAERRRELGVECPDCIRREPRRNPTILLPGQKCYCGYRDPRRRQADKPISGEFAECPTCGKSVKRIGLSMHHLAKHGTALLNIPKSADQDRPDPTRDGPFPGDVP